MTAVGIDFGSLHSKIGVARRRGIDIITNEVSNRQTPSLVAFGPKQRDIGESAKTKETFNFRNTIGGLKRLIGRTLSDPEVQNIEKTFMNATLVDVDGTVGVEVQHLGQTKQFSATQLVGAYFGKLRDIASKELKVGVTDIVLAVPVWFTDIQRRAIIDAASIAGLRILRLINDTTATALGYGITKPDLPDTDDPKHVVFVDVGHSSLSTAVVAFSKGQLTMKSSAFDTNVGGRYIDQALVNHFSEQFKTKYKIDVLSSPKATFRLAAGCDKLKKILSANLEAPLNVESIMNDIDASSRLTREEYETLITSVLDRIPAPLSRALEGSGLTLEQIDAVELIGGCTRIPAVRAKIQSVFPGKVLSTTLNQDEAIARGATFAGAMLSPVFRVRDFQIHDVQAYPIKVEWEKAPEDPDEDTELIVFPKGNNIPSTKVLTFYRNKPFEIQASYAEPSGLPGGINPSIAKFTAESVGPDAKGDLSCIKVKTRLDIHGLLSFEAAYAEAIEEKEETPIAVDGEPEAPPKKKKVVKKTEVPFIWASTSLDEKVVNDFREREAEMYATDKLVADTEDCKNALEEYVYDMRGKLDDRYAPFVQAAESEKLRSALTEAEGWLYSDEGEDASKSSYVAKLDALKALGNPIANRWKESEERSKSIQHLRETIERYLDDATSATEKYNHIDESDKQSVVGKVVTVRQWLDDRIARQSELDKWVDPVLKAADMLKKKEEIIYFCHPLLNKPKPKVAVPSPGGETPKSGRDSPQKGEPHGPSEMDVD